jgi:hypothetical protein
MKTKRRVGPVLAISLFVLGCASFGCAPGTDPPSEPSSSDPPVEPVESEVPNEDEAWLKGKVMTTGLLNHGVAYITVVARQVVPIEGYNRVEAETDWLGQFTLKGLYPSSKYELALDGDELGSYIASGDGVLETAPAGAVGLLPKDIVVSAAFTKSGSAFEIPSGKKMRARYPTSPDGVITDTKKDLQWYAQRQPGKVDQFDAQFRWAAQLDVDGGGWRMPTRGEVMQLYNEIYPNHIDVAFSNSVDGKINYILTDTLQDPKQTADIAKIVLVIDFDEANARWVNFFAAYEVHTFAVREKR